MQAISRSDAGGPTSSIPNGAARRQKKKKPPPGTVAPAIRPMLGRKLPGASFRWETMGRLSRQCDGFGFVDGGAGPAAKVGKIRRISAGFGKTKSAKACLQFRTVLFHRRTDRHPHRHLARAIADTDPHIRAGQFCQANSINDSPARSRARFFASSVPSQTRQSKNCRLSISSSMLRRTFFGQCDTGKTAQLCQGGLSESVAFPGSLRARTDRAPQQLDLSGHRLRRRGFGP